MDIKKMRKHLDGLLSTFTIPDDKRNNLKWLNDNIAIKNSGHRDLNEAKKIILKLLSIENKERNDTLLKLDAFKK
jgi:hypothetical protein